MKKFLPILILIMFTSQSNATASDNRYTQDILTVVGCTLHNDLYLNTPAVPNRAVCTHVSTGNIFNLIVGLAQKTDPSDPAYADLKKMSDDIIDAYLTAQNIEKNFYNVVDVRPIFNVISGEDEQVFRVVSSTLDIQGPYAQVLRQCVIIGKSGHAMPSYCAPVFQANTLINKLLSDLTEIDRLGGKQLLRLKAPPISFELSVYLGLSGVVFFYANPY